MSRSGNPSFEQVMAGLAESDQVAARRLYERFVDRLVALAARTLDKRLGAKVDPESVAQSVFESFFDRHGRGQFQLQNWGMVLGLLSHMTFRKCLNRNRDLRAQKRDAGPDISIADWQAAGREPGPAEAAIVAEQLTLALAAFDEDEQAILNAFLGGRTVEQTARELKFTTRTVYRVIERFRKRLDQLLHDEE